MSWFTDLSGLSFDLGAAKEDEMRCLKVGRCFGICSGGKVMHTQGEMGGKLELEVSVASQAAIAGIVDISSCISTLNA